MGNKKHNDKEVKTKHLTLGLILKGARVEKGMSQGEVASFLGYSTPQFISNIERNLANPPLAIIRKLVTLYGVHPEHIYKALVSQYESKVAKALKLKSN